MKIIDITGQRFGRLTAERYDHTDRGFAMWMCRCDCGNTAVVSGYNLRAGKTKSCGCLRREMGSEQARKNRKEREERVKAKTKKNLDEARENIGKTFGHLTVTGIAERPPGKNGVIVHCRCDCGAEKDVYWSNLRSGQTSSCGHIRQDRLKAEAETMIGKRYGNLVIACINHEKSRAWNKRAYDCRCDCGRTTTVRRIDLIQGRVKSCGCSRGFTAADKAFVREHGCSVCADAKTCPKLECKYETELGVKNGE